MAKTPLSHEQLDAALEAMASGTDLSTHAARADLPLGPLRTRLLDPDYCDRYQVAYTAWIHSLPEQAINIADAAIQETERASRLQAETRTRVYSTYVGAKAAGQPSRVQLEVIVKRELPDGAYVQSGLDEKRNALPPGP